MGRRTGQGILCVEDFRGEGMNLTLKELKIIENLLNTDLRLFYSKEKEDLLHKVQRRANHIEYQGKIIDEIKQNQTKVYVC